MGVGGWGGRSRAGFGWQTKGATRRCRDGAQHSPSQEAVKGVGTGRSEGDGEPPSILQTHAHAHVHTLSRKLTWALYKSLSLNVSVAASGKPSTQLSNVARRNFSSSATATHAVSIRHFLVDTAIIYIHTPERSQMYKLRHFYRHPCLPLFHPLQPPGLLFFIKVSFKSLPL